MNPAPFHPPVLDSPSQAEVEPMRRTQPRRDTSITLALALSMGLGLTVVSARVQAQPPGPERFAVQPTTPIDIWGAVDYLVKSGQSEQAVAYLKKFIAANPSDDDLLAIRDRYGFRSFLKLAGLPATKAQSEILIARMDEAAKRKSADPDRLAKAIAAIPKSREEQANSLEELKAAGPFSVPPLLDALRNSALGSEQRNIYADSIAKLDSPAVPPLMAALDTKDAGTLIDVIKALGRIGDKRAVPDLAYLAADPDIEPTIREAASKAVEKLTGRPLTGGTKAAVKTLIDQARSYHLHKAKLDTPLVWTWNEEEGKLTSKPAAITEEEEALGLRAAKKALKLAPGDLDAQATLVAIALDKAVGRVGLEAYPKGEEEVANLAAMAGSDVLDRDLKQAIADGKYELSAALIGTLGKMTNRDALSSGSSHSLAQALSAPDRRTQFAAAKALVELEPRKPFNGSSKVIPTLARFLAPTPAPVAVIIDGNAPRANTLGAELRTLGYDVDVATSGDEGFRHAAASAGVELVLIEPYMARGAWRLEDILGNLRLDPRTAGLPIFVYGKLSLEDTLSSRLREYPGVTFLVNSGNIPTLKAQLDRQLPRMGSRPLSTEERRKYAVEAATLIGKITKVAGSPFEPDLQRASEALSTAVRSQVTAEAAISALGDIPGVVPQRALADALLDSGQPIALRVGAAAQLQKSVQRFGPLVSADQERLLVSLLDAASDQPELKTAIAGVIGALKPKSEQVGKRLSAYKTPATASLTNP